MALWHVSRDGQQHGPYDDKTLRDLATQGRLVPTDFIWKEGMGDWVPASKLKGLFGDQAAAGASPAVGEKQAGKPVAASAAPAKTNVTPATAAPVTAQPSPRAAAQPAATAARQPQRARRTRTRRAAADASAGWGVRLAMICAIAMLSTLILPWFIGEGVSIERVNGRSVRTVGTQVKMFWHMMDEPSGAVVLTLVCTWLLAIGAIVATFASSGFARTITHASIGVGCLVILLIQVFGSSSMMASGSGSSFNVLHGLLCCTAVVIVTHVHLRRGPSMELGLLQSISAGAVLLFAIIFIILQFTDNGSLWNRSRELEAFFKSAIIIFTCGLLAGGTLLLIHGIKYTKKPLAVAGIWTIYGTLLFMHFGIFIAVIIASERWGTLFMMINTFSLLGGLAVLFCSSQVQLISALLKRSGQGVATASAGQVAVAALAGDASTSSDGPDIEAKFTKLKQLLEHGHVTQEQYDQKQAALLDQL